MGQIQMKLLLTFNSEIFSIYWNMKEKDELNIKTYPVVLKCKDEDYIIFFKNELAFCLNM